MCVSITERETETKTDTHTQQALGAAAPGTRPQSAPRGLHARRRRPARLGRLCDGSQCSRPQGLSPTHTLFFLCASWKMFATEANVLGLKVIIPPHPLSPPRFPLMLLSQPLASVLPRPGAPPCELSPHPAWCMATSSRSVQGERCLERASACADMRLSPSICRTASRRSGSS